MRHFLNNSSMSGIVLFSAALIALILFNSPWSEPFHHFWEINFSIGFGDHQLSKTLHHWINDGLMAAFTIPARVKCDEITYGTKLDQLLSQFKAAHPNNSPTVTTE